MPANLRKDLNSCMEYYFQESQPTPHSGLSDAECVGNICQEFAKTLGYDYFEEFLQNNSQYLHPF